MAAVTICSDFGVQKKKSLTLFPLFLHICHEVMGPDAMILVFWILSFKPIFLLFSFSFIKQLFSSSLFAIKGPSSQSYGFSSSHVWMWALDYKESWVPKNWCFWTVVLEKTLESPLDCKEIQPVHPKGDECWVFIGRTDVEAETPILWPLNAKSWLIW